MRIAVCEDIKQEADWICNVIREWADDDKIAMEVVSFSNAEEFMFALEDVIFDALFLDIKMPGEDGVSLAKRLRKTANNVPIVFVTGEKEYILEGYEVEAVNYLIKPVERVKIFECLDRIYEKNNIQEPFIILETGQGSIRLLQKDIYMIEANLHKLVYTTAKGRFEVNSSMKRASDELLKEWFVVCHRGVIINLLYVNRIEKDVLLLYDEKNDFSEYVPVSRREYSKINQAFIKLYKKNEPE